MSSVFDVAKKLNKDYKNDKLILTADKQPSYQRLGVCDLGFDFPLYGGLPYGRLVTISGRQHSGKTLGACTVMSAYQRENPDKTCVYVDVEAALDKEFVAQMTGLDLTKMMYLCPDGLSAEQIFSVILELLDCDDIGMVILDSAAALVSGADYDSDMEKDNGMRGSVAKPLHRFMRTALASVHAKGNILLVINQVRISGKTFTGANIYSEPTGDALPYYSSVMMRFGTRTFTKDDKVDLRDGEGADGIRLQFAITKNKTASVQRGGGFLTFRYDSGLDWITDLLEVAMKYEFIKHPNNLTYILWDLENDCAYTDSEGNELKFAGKAKLKKFLSENVDFQNTYLDMLSKHINATANTYGSLLDARELAELKSQESQCVDHEKADSTVNNEDC